jgi:hypothetical protein
MVYGTDNGVYLLDLGERDQPPLKVLELAKVTQVDILEELQLLIVLFGMVFCSPFCIPLFERSSI